MITITLINKSSIMKRLLLTSTAFECNLPMVHVLSKLSSSKGGSKNL